MSLPTGVVTFLLTDLVGSTELWERVPQQMSAALARHDELVVANVVHAGGTVLKARGEGDSTFSVFTRATDAVRAAHRLQVALRAESWPPEAVIRARVAVHTGEAIERDGDYLGPAVNRVARLRGVARGGEIVVSAATATIAGLSLPDGCELVDLGVLQLRGLDEPERAFALAAVDLEPVDRGSRPGHSSLPPALALLADPRSYVGRAGEREALWRQWQLARAGHTLLVLVTAEAGMGKSRIVAELARAAHADGARVLFGACFEDVDRPFGPFAQAITDDAAALDSPTARRYAGDLADALGRLSPELAGVLGDDDVLSRSLDASATDGGTMLDAVRQWLGARAADSPVLLVLEDLHWSTSTTRDAVRHIVERAGRTPMLVVATSRDTAPDVDPGLVELFGQLERSPMTTRVGLRGLDPDEVAELTGAATDDAMVIVRETGGNPLLVTYHVSDGRRDSLDAMLTSRYRLLDDEAGIVLDLAATLGSEFDAGSIAAGTGLPMTSVLDSLEAAEAAGLVVPHVGRPGRHAFVHALFRSHRYSRVSSRRRMELHSMAVTALASRREPGSLSELARHACLAVPLGDPSAAIELAREAGEAAESTSAYDEAAVLYERGADAARALEPPDRAVELDLTIRVAAARHHHGDPRGLPALLEAARRADEVDDGPALVRAVMAFNQFGAVGIVGANPEWRELTHHALNVLGDQPSATRARLLMDLASHWFFVDCGESLRMARDAEAMARTLGDDDALGSVLLNARHLYCHPRHVDERRRIGSELERLGRGTDRLVFSLAGIVAQCVVLLELGDVTASRAAYERMESLLGDRSFGYFQLVALSQRAIHAFLSGDLERAESYANETVPRSMGIGARTIWRDSVLAVIRRMQGRDDELLPTYERAARRTDQAWLRCSYAALAARAGSLDEALTTLRQLRDEQFAVAEDYPWPVAITDLAEAAEVAGDPDAAQHVLAVASSFSGRIASAGPNPNRPFDQALAQAALAIGDVPAAEAFASKAVAASRVRGTVPFLARELVFLAEARRRAGAPRSDVDPLLAEAMSLAEPMGAHVVARDIERLGLGT